MNGDTLYAWQECQEGGHWGIIAAIHPTLGVPVPLVARSEEIAGQFRPLADAHRHASGNPVRLARFELAEVVEERA